MSTGSYTEFVLISYPIQWFWGISHQYSYISINKTAIDGLRFWNSIQVRRRVIGCKKASSHHSHILSAQFPPYRLLIYTSPTYQVNLLGETEENILTRKTLWLRILPPKLWAISKKMLKPRCRNVTVDYIKHVTHFDQIMHRWGQSPKQTQQRVFWNKHCNLNEYATLIIVNLFVNKAIKCSSSIKLFVHLMNNQTYLVSKCYDMLARLCKYVI